MSAGYGPPAVNTFGMITGIGDAIGRSYDAARKQAQEDEAPAIFSKLVGIQSPDATPAPAATLGTMGQSYRDGGVAAAQPAKLPSFAGGGSAPMRVPGSGGEIETKFVDALKAGGLTNPYGLGAMAAYAGRESGYKGSNITGSWSDPSESGQPGTSGGILSWRGDRFANMRRLTAGAADPVTAQAKFALTENPELTLALQQAKSPEEANALMAQAWKFAGWNRQGGENAARLASTRAYVASLGGATPAAQGAAPQMATADRPMTMPGAPAAAGTVAQAPLPQMGTAAPAQVAAPSTVAQGDPDAANKPASNAQPTGFVIPGQDAPAAQGFPGFGSPASRITPAQQEILTAAWKNPVTRPMATEIYGQLLKGRQSQWQLSTMGDQPVLFNQATAQIVPVGQAKRQTATVGNTVIDTATGQPIYQGERDPKTATVGNTIVDLRTGQPVYQAPEKPMVVGGALVSPEGKVVYEGKDDKFSYQQLPGVGMVALHPTDPDKSRVIIAGQQPRPLTADERTAYQIPAGTGGGMGADGKPFTLGGGAKTEVNVDTKGANKFTEKANEIQAKRYGEMVDAADNAVPLKADIDIMAGLGAQISTGRLAEARLGLAQYAKSAGLDSIANSLTNGKMGEMEAFTALADKLTPRMRVPGSGSTSDAEGRAFKNSLPSMLKSPEGNAIIVDTFRSLADYQSQAGEIAGKALRGEISQSEADQALRALPSPYTRFKAYQGGQGGQGGASDASPAPLPKGKDRIEIPGGLSAGAAIAQAKKAVAAGKDKAAIAERLRTWGIDPKRLDD